MLSQENQRPHIQSVSRTVAILKCFLEKNEIGITEIARMVGLRKSTTAGLVSTLKDENILEQNEVTGKYRLGLTFFEIASRSKTDLRTVAEPYLQELLEITNETVNLAVLSDTEVIYLSKMESTHSIRITTSIGTRLPVFCTAIGKAMLAFLERREAENIINRIEFTPFTDKTITDKERFVDTLDVIRSTGIAMDNEEYERGVICIATPLISNSGRPVGAISVSGPKSRMTREACDKIISALKVTAGNISRELVRTEQ